MSNDGNLRQEEGPALWMRSWPVSREFLSCSRSENGPGGRSRPGKIFGRVKKKIKTRGKFLGTRYPRSLPRRTGTWKERCEGKKTS